MENWLNKNEFTKVFEPYSEKGVQIWVVTRIKKLPAVIVKMATLLADLDFIKCVRICNETLAASSENYPNRPKVPITNMNHETAIGIQIIYSTKYKTIDFFDINAPKKGFGGKMVDAVFQGLPHDWLPAVAMDWSNGFWDRMKEKYRKNEWIL
jgi:hypothetical protein